MNLFLCLPHFSLCLSFFQFIFMFILLVVIIRIIFRQKKKCRNNSIKLSRSTCVYGRWEIRSMWFQRTYTMSEKQKKSPNHFHYSNINVSSSSVECDSGVKWKKQTKKSRARTNKRHFIKSAHFHNLCGLNSISSSSNTYNNNNIDNNTIHKNDVAKKSQLMTTCLSRNESNYSFIKRKTERETK